MLETSIKKGEDTVRAVVGYALDMLSDRATITLSQLASYRNT